MAGQSGAQVKSELSTIKSKLLWRMAFALLMILALLGGLALFDHFTARVDTAAEPPVFTEPVPVAKKMVTQPLSPAEPPVVPTEEPKALVEPEASTAPTEKSLPLEQPPPPEVAAQPALPKTRPARTNSRPSVIPHATVESSSPAEAKPISAPAAAVHQTVKVPPNPPRLFSGYALQAGVFSDPHRAEELYTRLVEAGIPATLETRVQVGPFKSKAEALAAKEKMKALGVEAMMLPKRGKL